MEIFNYLWFVLYGFIAGVIAKTLFPSKDEGGLIITVALGICGSIVGGFVFSLFGWPMAKSLSLYGLIPACTGGILILFIYNFVKKKLK